MLEVWQLRGMAHGTMPRFFLRCALLLEGRTREQQRRQIAAKPGQQRYIKVRNIKVEDAMRQLAQAFEACTGSVQLPEQPKLVN